MTETKPHSDNALIDELEDQGGAPDQGGRSGGATARDVGTRSEMRNTATGNLGDVRPTAQDHPEAMNEAKGERTIARLDPAKDAKGR